MTNLEYYSAFFTIQLRVQEYIKEYVMKIGTNNKFSYIGHATESTVDIRDLVKQCPNPDCGLIWFRI
jgi:hypothetical protein